VGATWKIQIKEMSTVWMCLGIIGTTDTSNVASYSIPTSHLWAGGAEAPNEVFIAGEEAPGHGGWAGFRTGDVCVFKLEQARLRMRCARIGATIFDIPLTGTGPWYAHVNLHQSNSEVVLLPTTAKDIAGL
jgi:hypothetical protein